MSYPYDSNPWDDSYATNTHQNTQATGYPDSYSNPPAQYANPDTGADQQQYQYQDQQQQQYAEQEAIQQQSAQQSPPQSAIRRFLRQNVPLCGAIMDTLSGINLPFLDALVQNVNKDLLVSKIFYFFFYSAFGSLFPLMGVYFKQLGMNPAQVGILTGVRPIIEIFSAPFWNSLAERFHKSKALLLFSLLSWIVFTHSLAHIRPPASNCIAFNDTDYVLYTPYSSDDLGNFEVGQIESGEPTSTNPNEVFMNKMPSSEGNNIASGGGKDREVKGEILASEENQNDQRRRRRRKRQIEGGDTDGKARFVYSIDEETKDGESESLLDLNVDLENDFDDKLINQEAKRDSHGEWAFFEHDNGKEVESHEKDELDQLVSKGVRYERSVNMRDIDDVLGESDAAEPEEVDSNGKKEEERRRKEKSGVKEKDEGEEEEEEDEKGEGGDGAKKDRDSSKSEQESSKSSTVSTTTTMGTTTELSYEIAPKESSNMVNKTKRVFKHRHKTPPTHIVGMSPITVEYAVNYKKEKHSQLVTPMFSTVVYKLDDIKEVFFLLLLLISLGEFFSAPALTLADSATLSYLGENTDLYGRQRMFGSLSWAVTLLLVGMALDNATSIADHPCGPHQRERSYNVCFIIFSLLMACAFLTATQFRFNYPKSGSSGSHTLVTSTNNSNTIVTTTLEATSGGAGDIDEFYASTQPRSIFNTAPPVNAPPPNEQQGKEKFEFLDKWKSAVFAQRTWEVPEWVNVFRQFRNSLHLTYLFITWFLGCGVGLVFTFLFWHLQDVGGTPTLFGICSVINHISEILAYFFSFSIIKRFGHTRVLSVGLGCNVIRFLYVAFLTDPYYALPFELVQGITHAACFAACCSYISHVSKPELRTSTQGVMQGLHHGIGRACGALMGGYMINAIGSRASFCIYGLLSGCVLAGFLYIRKRASEMEDEEVKVDDSEALGGYGAPQGVPSAIPGKIAQTVSNQDIDYQW